MCFCFSKKMPLSPIFVKPDSGLLEDHVPLKHPLAGSMLLDGRVSFLGPFDILF